MAAIEERQQKIAEGLAAADNAQKNLAQAQDTVNEAMKEARAKANEIIEQAHQRASQMIDQAKTDAIAEAGRQKALAQAEIDAASNRAREELRKQVSLLAVTGAEKLLRREIDANAHKALLDELARRDLTMSQALTLARPYARAAFAIARDEKTFADWSQALGFAARIAADPQVATLLGNPRLSDAGAVTLLSPQDADPSFARFLGLLADNRRLALLPEIAGLYEELRAEAERVVKATVTSATALAGRRTRQDHGGAAQALRPRGRGADRGRRKPDRRRGDRRRRRGHRRLAARASSNACRPHWPDKSRAGPARLLEQIA